MTWKVINGNNIDILKQYPDNHFDSIVTDPPYGIEFLGKDWDKNTGAMETWEECLRVLKPGGYLLAFSAARTYHHLATNIESVGFEVRDQLMWIYSSGFPKSQDIGKAIERKSGERKKLPYFNASDIVGMGTECPKCNKKENGINQYKCKENPCPLKEVLKPADNEWAGWKTALKPAHEPIVMARKPFKGSCVDNVMEWGTGALNIDESRIGDEVVITNYKVNTQGKSFGYEGNVEWEDRGSYENTGRYPSNVMGDIPEYQKYFYCPKVSRKERMEGNNHPTVKPVELMKYLIRLVTPKGGLVLDPFNGSGSTGMACVELGMSYVGCELDPDYVEIAQKRIAAWEKKFDNPINNLFDIDE